MLITASIDPRVPNAQQLPQLPWFLTEVIQFDPLTFLQSNVPNGISSKGADKISTSLCSFGILVPHNFFLSSSESCETFVLSAFHFAPFFEIASLILFSSLSTFVTLKSFCNFPSQVSQSSVESVLTENAVNKWIPLPIIIEKYRRKIRIEDMTILFMIITFSMPFFQT